MPTDLEKLQGRWYIQSLELDGAALSPGGFAGAEIVLTGNRFQSLSMGAVYEGTIELQSAKRPKALKMRFTKGPEKGNVNNGIYELQKDGWRLCLSMTGGPAPATFATAPGSGCALETLARTPATVPREVQAAAALPAGDPTPELEGEWAMVSCVRDGHALDERMVKSGRRICNGNLTRVLFGRQPLFEAQFCVDRSKAPMTMDYLLTSGPDRGKGQLGIYELSGRELKLLFGSPGQSRPTEFTTMPGAGKTFTIWRKMK